MDPAQVGIAFLDNPIQTAIGVALIALVTAITGRGAAERRRRRLDSERPNRDEPDSFPPLHRKRRP